MLLVTIITIIYRKYPTHTNFLILHINSWKTDYNFSVKQYELEKKYFAKIFRKEINLNLKTPYPDVTYGPPFISTTLKPLSKNNFSQCLREKYINS